MKLTPRGKDYVKASLYGAIVSSIFDVRIILALCLALLVSAALSEIILARATTGNIQVQFNDPHLTCFKEGEVREDFRINYRTRRFVKVRISSITGPKGVETITDESSQDGLRLIFRPKFAGRFKGLRAKFDFSDPLELFAKSLEVSIDDFVLDCIPASLLKEIRTARPMALALGEKIGRTHGSGQEFYAIDEYHPAVERKNIFWKKIASMADERLLVKVRESNIPKFLTIGLIRTIDRGEEQLQWTDRACEGVALLGKNIFSVGCGVHLVFETATGPVRLQAQDLAELSDAVMQLSVGLTSEIESTSEILYESDICVTGLKELKVDLLALAIARKPSLLIEDKDTFPRTIGNLAVIFTGNEDVSELVHKVVGR
ncbi:MAG: hypothetical protein OK457_10175 [Thaumarchaeota archaeon]|nr:hypothetical protein [Nitrososphaerota archaeon]